MILDVSVLGCGNSLVGNDAVGLEVLETLRAHPPRFAGVSVRLVEAATGGLDIIEHLTGCDRAIVVDAILAGGLPGDVRVFDADRIPDPVEQAFSLHGIDLPHALAIGRALYPDRMAPVKVVGIEVGRPPEPTDRGLSPEVAAAVTAAAGAVHGLLEEWSREVVRDA